MVFSKKLSFLEIFSKIFEASLFVNIKINKQINVIKINYLRVLCVYSQKQINERINNV